MLIEVVNFFEIKVSLWLNTFIYNTSEKIVLSCDCSLRYVIFKYGERILSQWRVFESEFNLEMFNVRSSLKDKEVQA
jgi:hypothetical protein